MDEQNLLELVVRTIDQSSSKLNEIKTSVQGIGDAASKQTGQISQLEVGLKQLENQAEKTGKAAKNMEQNLLNIRNLYFLSFLWSNLSYYGGQLIETFVGMSTGAAKWNREIQNVQTQFGFTNKEAVGLQISLQDVGRNIGDIDQGMRMFTLRMYEASKGTGHGADAMARLGYTSKEAKDIGLLPTGQALDKVIERMQNLGSTAERNTIAVAMFGRSAVTMMPIIERGLEAGRVQAELFESTFTSLEQFVSGRALDSFREFSRSAEAMGRHIGIVATEALLPLATMASQVMEAMSRHVKSAMPIIEEDFGLKSRDQGGGLGKWFADNIDKASEFLIKLHDTQRVLEVIDSLHNKGPSSAGFGWDWGTMSFQKHGASAGASYDEIMGAIYDKFGSRIPRKGVPGQGTGILEGMKGGSLISSAGVFEGAPGGPMTSLDELTQVDLTFDRNLQLIQDKITFKALTIAQAVQQLQTLLTHAENQEQASKVYGALSQVRSMGGNVKNPWANAYPGAGAMTYVPTDIVSGFRSTPLISASPGDDLARVLQRTNASGDPLSADQMANNLAKSLKKENIDELNKSLALSNDKFMRMVMQFDNWTAVTDRMTDSLGHVSEEGVAFVSGLEAVRQNLFLGGNAMYDFAYNIAQGVSNALNDGFEEVYKMLENGTFKLKNAMQKLVESLVQNVQHEMLMTLSKLMANKILGGASGSGAGFSPWGFATAILGMVNPLLGLGAGLAGQVVGSFGGGYKDPGGSGGWSGVNDPTYGVGSGVGGTLVGPPSPGSNMVSSPKSTGAQVYVAPGAVQVSGGLMDTDYVKEAITNSLAYMVNKAMAEGAVRGTY